MEFLTDLAAQANAQSEQFNPAVAWMLRIAAAIVALIVGYFLAKILSGVIGGVINRIPLVRDANETAGPGSPKIGTSIGQAIFWLLMLVVFAIALAILGLTQVVEPVQNMWDQILSFLPNLIGAAAWIGLGLIFANILRRAIHSVLTAAQLDNLVARTGVTDVTGAGSLSAALSWIAYAFVALFAISGGITALGVDAISTPIQGMLDEIINAIPNVIAFAVVLAITFLIARFVSMLILQVLPQFGIDAYVEKLGLLEKKSESGLTASSAIANVVGIAIMLIGALEATRLLGFEMISDFIDIIIAQGGQILFGAVIIFAFVVLSNVIGRLLDAAGTGASDFVANIVKYVILGLGVILGVSRMGLDPTGGLFILDVTRYLVIAGAVAIALAFGLGGREWAGEQLKKWRS